MAPAAAKGVKPLFRRYTVLERYQAVRMIRYIRRKHRSDAYQNYYT